MTTLVCLTVLCLRCCGASDDTCTFNSLLFVACAAAPERGTGDDTYVFNSLVFVASATGPECAQVTTLVCLTSLRLWRVQQGLSAAQVKQAEGICNEVARGARPVYSKVVSLVDAKTIQGLRAVFDEVTLPSDVFCLLSQHICIQSLLF